MLYIATVCFSQKNPICNCIEYKLTDFDNRTPLLEFKEAFSGSQLHEISNGIFWDTVLVERYLKQTNYNSLSEFYNLNLSADNYYQDSPEIGYAKEEDTALINSIYIQFLKENNELIEDRLRFIWSLKSNDKYDNEELYFTLYIVKEEQEKDELLTNKNIETVRISSNDYNKGEFVAVSFEEEGSELWRKMTKKNIGKFISIISENKALSTPIINGVITGGETMITWNFTKEENENLFGLLYCDRIVQRIGQKKFDKELKKCK